MLEMFWLAFGVGFFGFVFVFFFNLVAIALKLI